MTSATTPTPPSRKRGCLLFLLILFLIAVAVLVLDEIAPVLWAKGKVVLSAPGVGATREEVEGWLDQQGIRHSRHSLSDHGGYPACLSPAEFGDLASGVQGAYIVGRIRVPHLYDWVSYVWIYFFFDSDGRLIQNIVKRWDAYF
jgi:hypothetical protein